ncbi:MAG: TonB family protein [Pseudomonadota bacterium]
MAVFLLPDKVEEDTQTPIEISVRQVPAPKPPTPEPIPFLTEQLTKISIPKQPVQAPAKQPPVSVQPQGDQEAKEEPSADTGPKVFGIDMSGTTTVPSGTGVQIPVGQSLEVSPSVKRVGKGKPDGQPGFKGNYEPGEFAPIAVIKTMPKVLREIVPSYPERMRDLGIEGRVVLQLTINENGEVKKVRLLRGLRKELDDAAIDAAKKMLFEPAQVNNVPVSIKIRYTFTFVLD